MNKPESKIIETIKSALGGEKRAMTLADVSTKSGLSLFDAKEGLNYLIAEYRGGLSATSDGELLYSFPTGFTKPWETKERLEIFLEKAKKSGLGALKFIVRAWISVVMVAYVAIFAIILIAITFSKSSDREDNSSFSSNFMMHMLLRMVFDSLFWTFHPFSPFRIDYANDDRVSRRKDQTPFYERVNRFFFGPEEKPFDINEAKRAVLQEIRAKKGHIGILDVIRVTGLSKEAADPFMAKLLVEHDGDVKVSLDGGIYYEFAAMRKSALDEQAIPAPPIWHRREKLLPFTGNRPGSNILIAGLNGFNLVMSSVAIASGWTIEKFRYFFLAAKSGIPIDQLPPPPEGVPLLLGWIPFIFSLALFAIPVLRAMNRGQKRQKINRNNGKRGLIRVILNSLGFKAIDEGTLARGWTEQAQVPPGDKELTQEIVNLGGEAEVSEDGKVTYAFKALESELAALENARKRTGERGVHVGDVVFSSLK